MFQKFLSSQLLSLRLHNTPSHFLSDSNLFFLYRFRSDLYSYLHKKFLFHPESVLHLLDQRYHILQHHIPLSNFHLYLYLFPGTEQYHSVRILPVYLDSVREAQLPLTDQLPYPLRMFCLSHLLLQRILLLPGSNHTDPPVQCPPILLEVSMFYSYIRPCSKPEFLCLHAMSLA